MRKLIATLIASVALVIGVAGPASAKSSRQSDFGYAVATNQFGVINCANGYTEVGEALAPGYLYVFTRAYRTQGYLCGGGGLGGPGAQIAYVDYTLQALSPYGVWFDCHSGMAYNAAGSYQAVLDNAYTGCGNLRYRLWAHYAVGLDYPNGAHLQQLKAVLIEPGTLNG